MDEKTTRGLSKILEGIEDHTSADSFILEHANNQVNTFHEFLQLMMEKKHINKSEVVRRCGISSNYVYQILSGSRDKPSRDKAIALCVATEMSYKETQKALEIAGLAPLYPRDERDVRIAIAINGGTHDALEINLMLDRYDLAPLDI